jgi:tetratricopeptide (TPR) repeat protein
LEKQLAAALARADQSARENQALRAQLKTLLAGDTGGQALREENALLKKQAAAGSPPATTPPGRGDAAAQLARLTEQVETLQARLAVAEARPVPYSAEELALFRQSAPGSPAGGAALKSIRELPAGSAALVVSARAHFAAREYDLAAADYRQILAHDPNNGLALANLAAIELQQGRLTDAEQHLQAAVAQSPQDPYNLTLLGNLKFQQEKYDEALDILGRAATLDPRSAEIENLLGVTLGLKGLRPQAEAALRKALLLDPDYGDAHNNLAVIYLNEQPPQAELARWHYLKAIAAGRPRNPGLEKDLADHGAPVPPE